MIEHNFNKRGLIRWGLLILNRAVREDKLQNSELIIKTNFTKWNILILVVFSDMSSAAGKIRMLLHAWLV